MAEVTLFPTFLGAVNDSGIFRIDLSTSGLASIQSITIEDDNIISGGTGGASGFDLDTIKLSSTLSSSPSEIAALDGFNIFNFSDGAVVFQPGFLQPWQFGDAPIWNRDQLLGTIGLGVDFTLATLGVVDGTNAADSGSVSIGESGKITFSLTAPVLTDSLYLYVADTGGGNDGFQVTVSDAATQPIRQGLTLFGTDFSDVINLVIGFNGFIGGGNDRINGGGGNDEIFTGGGRDICSGDDGNDVLDGGQDNDRLFGGAGNDQLLGQQGNDRLVGGLGFDTLDGDKGNNKLTGGKDQDIFVLNRGAGKAIALDFRIRQDVLGIAGRIRLSRIDIIDRGRNVLLRQGGDQLAVLRGVNADAISDFTVVEV
ncbi:MAG: calcium-binding protein [Leptolyngbyaceae bacterium]|nr:calcium-binding protein [Leptolyngbyaceae bacterium]